MECLGFLSIWSLHRSFGGKFNVEWVEEVRNFLLFFIVLLHGLLTFRDELISLLDANLERGHVSLFQLLQLFRIGLDIFHLLDELLELFLHSLLLHLLDFFWLKSSVDLLGTDYVRVITLQLSSHIEDTVNVDAEGHLNDRFTCREHWDLVESDFGKLGILFGQLFVTLADYKPDLRHIVGDSSVCFHEGSRQRSVSRNDDVHCLDSGFGVFNFKAEGAWRDIGCLYFFQVALDLSSQHSSTVSNSFIGVHFKVESPVSKERHEVLLNSRDAARASNEDDFVDLVSCHSSII